MFGGGKERERESKLDKREGRRERELDKEKGWQGGREEAGQKIRGERKRSRGRNLG